MHEIMSRNEVAQKLKIPKDKVKQIELQALRKLRKWCAKNGIKISDLV
jgi:DNA-directed RNA polymerase sigma subunit (sigma70/sigma32)